MKVVDRRHFLVFASIILGAVAAVLIAHAGTAAGHDAGAAPQPAAQMIVPF